jgi:hypothetical protein
MANAVATNSTFAGQPVAGSAPDFVRSVSPMTKATCKATWWLAILVAVCAAPSTDAQGVIGAELPSDTVKYDDSLAATYKSGKTNAVPLLRLYWFSDPDGHTPAYYREHWFSLAQSGQASTGVSSISNGARWYALSKTDLLSLFEAVRNLPEPPKGTLAYERQIIISGVRSNEWFRAIYDRAAIPKEVAEVFKRTGAHLEAYSHKAPNKHLQATPR